MGGKQDNGWTSRRGVTRCGRTTGYLLRGGGAATVGDERKNGLQTYFLQRQVPGRVYVQKQYV